MKKKFLIYAPPFDPDSGGSIVLHKLCDLLNRSNCEAYIYPAIPSFELNIANFKQLEKMIGDMSSIVSLSKNYKTNPEFITPVMESSFGDQAGDEWIVVYPEITFGNPLNAKNIIRWMLFTPGFHTNKIYFTNNELHFYFNKKFRNHKFPGVIDSNLELKIEHFPFELYSKNFNNNDRVGVAYCIRKAGNIEIPFDAEHDFLIDGKSHQEISNIFGRVKSFVSYDQYTAYSSLAAVSGCDSIIYRDELNLNADLIGLNGVAYGFEDIDRAKKTLPVLFNFFDNKEINNKIIINSFLDIVDNFLNKLDK